MRDFDYITPDNPALESITKETLVKRYNNAVEEIYFLRRRNNELHEENEALWKAYEDISEQFYG